MDDDTARKISEIKAPSDNEAEIEEYENLVMEIKNKSVSSIVSITLSEHVFLFLI